MHWTLTDLMTLPVSYYVELIAMLDEEPKG